MNTTVMVVKVIASIMGGLESEMTGCNPINSTHIIPLIRPFLRLKLSIVYQ